MSLVSPLYSSSDTDQPRESFDDVSLVQDLDDRSVSKYEYQESPHPEESKTESNGADRQKALGEEQLWKGFRRQRSAIPGGSVNRGWKPWTVRTPALLSFIAMSIILAAVLEVLAQRSRNYGGLALSPSVDEIPNGASFAALYLPTTIAVFYSLYWSWTELHVKKIQPWFNLSRSGGATAENSLLLDYPFEFLAFVPFKAARRGHWPAVYAGTIIVMIFWLITPLQSAVFGAGSSSLTQSIMLSASSTLLPVQEQAVLLDASVLNEAFATTWLGQSFPSSVTADSAVLPFRAVQQPAFAQDSIWTGYSWQLSTDLQCWSANVSRAKGYDRFDNGQGCTADMDVSLNSNASVFAVRYIGYYNDAQSDWSLANPLCDDRFRHQFLAIVGTATSPGSVIGNVTALFCEPSYHKQNITISISAATMKPDFASMTPVGDLLPLTDDEFNRTAFEYLLATGLPSDNQQGPGFAQAPEQYPRISAKDPTIAWPVTNMVGFAAGSTNYTAAQLQDPIALRDAFMAAHRSVFSVAVSKLLSGVSEPQEGTIQFTISGIIVSRPISAVVEALLVTVAVLAGLTLFHCRRASSMLQRDPSSIGETMRILQQDESLLSQLSDLDRASESELRQFLGTARFELFESDTPGSLLGLRALRGLEPGGLDNAQMIPGKSAFDPVKPKELRVATGISLIIFLAGGVALLLYLKYKENTLGGLPRPSDNFEVLQLLENYIPTIFATFLEPLWVILNRIFCIVQPFRALQRGQSLPESSIEADYTSLPPQLAVWRAIRSRHYLLASICSVALLANVLAVGLGGVFNESAVDVRYGASFSPQSALSLSRDTVWQQGGLVTHVDHLEVVLTNLSEHTLLPAWTSPEVYFLPFFEHTSVHLASDSMQAQTWGVSLEPRCSAVSTDPTLGTYVHWVVNSTHQQLSLNTVADDGSHIRCGPQSGRLQYNKTGIPDSFDDTIVTNIGGSMPFPYGQSAMEISSRLSFIPLLHITTPSLIDSFCSKRLLTGWLRASGNVAGDIVQQPTSTFVQCTPVLRTAVYDVTVDSAGRVLKYETSGDVEDMMSFSPGNRTETLLVDIVNLVTQPSTQKWHNTTQDEDWVNNLLQFYLNSTSLFDPKEPVPDPDVVIPAVEAVYKELAAVLFGLNPDLFNSTDNATLIDGFVIRSETRIFISNAALIVSLVILGINIVVALVVYIRGLGVTLPRLPSTVGSILGYVAASRAVREYEGPTQGDKTRKAARRQTYTYGRFIGYDGKPHVGIELDPFVLPLETSRWNRIGSTRSSTSDMPGWV